MPRRARIAVPGIPWHIIQRGNNRTACFYADEDYWRYLETLQEQAEKQGCLIHAYCLMTNHVHLLLTPLHERSAAFLMKHLGQRYVQYINRNTKLDTHRKERQNQLVLDRSARPIHTHGQSNRNSDVVFR